MILHTKKKMCSEQTKIYAASEEKNYAASGVGICANICGITRFVRNTAHIRANICGITSVAKMTAYICINSWGKICIAPVISHIFAPIYAFIFPV